MRGDMQTLHAMFGDRDKIRRTIKLLENGVETLTESDDDDVVALLQEHVPAMESRVEDNSPLPPMTFHPIFKELIKHSKEVDFDYENTERGIKVIYTAKDPYVVMIIQEHARLVSRFIKHGMEEIHKPYSIPSLEEYRRSAKLPQETSSRADNNDSSVEYSHPAIAKYGKVVRLLKATQQPRDSSKIVVDVTKAGKPGELNPAIEKAARFVNIYRGAGDKPASVKIVLVVHGDATLSVLAKSAYIERFKTNDNPNLDCLEQLRKTGVEVYVCGQSLIGKGAAPTDVSEYASVAVSALTSLVNLQADGYAYVPLK